MQVITCGELKLFGPFLLSNVASHASQSEFFTLGPREVMNMRLRFSGDMFQVKALEYIGLAPEGSQRVSNFLEKAADGLVEGGK
jgi:hypothetical protein